MRFILVAALMLPVLSVWAEQQPVASISDASGDDHGSGSLVYPQRADFEDGDLDLLLMQVSRDAEGYWFEAKFRNAIRDPAAAPAVSGESLTDFARKGFYQFNIDIYIDTDRFQGSGNTFTLPGRKVGIDPAYAWERAVILTPRPELMRQQLLDALSEQFPGRANADTEARVDQAMFFPTRIRVRGKSISFFVPAGFFPEGDAGDWAVTAFVTGAITIIPADMSLLPATRKPLDRIQLGVMQPASGHPRDTFGYGPGEAMPGPVVDVLGATSAQQRQMLAANSAVVGVYREQHAANESARRGVAGDAPVTEQKASVMTIGNLLQLEVAGVQPGEAAPVESVPIEVPSIVKRLRALQQLYDQKLIDESEYKEQKQRILKEL